MLARVVFCVAQTLALQSTLALVLSAGVYDSFNSLAYAGVDVRLLVVLSSWCSPTHTRGKAIKVEFLHTGWFALFAGSASTATGTLKPCASSGCHASSRACGGDANVRGVRKPLAIWQREVGGLRREYLQLAERRLPRASVGSATEWIRDAMWCAVWALPAIVCMFTDGEPRAHLQRRGTGKGRALVPIP